MSVNTFKCKCTVCGKRDSVTIDDEAEHVKNARSMADELQNGWLSLWICSKKCQKEYEAK